MEHHPRPYVRTGKRTAYSKDTDKVHWQTEIGLVGRGEVIRYCNLLHMKLSDRSESGEFKKESLFVVMEGPHRGDTVDLYHRFDTIIDVIEIENIKAAPHSEEIDSE